MNKIVCKDCGFETDCGNDFCPNCGHKLVLPSAPHGNVASQVPPDIPMTAPPSNPVRTQIKITKPVIFAAVAVLAIIIAISAGVSYANDSVNMIIGELQDKNFNVAIEMYHEQIKRSDMERLEGRLIKRFEVIQDEFLNERMEYMDATSELNTIREFGIEGLSDKVNESAIYRRT